MNIFTEFALRCIHQTADHIGASLLLMIPLTFALYILNRKHKKSFLLCLLTAWSIAHIFAMTLLGREPGSVGKRFELELFWSYKEALYGNTEMGMEIAANILLFIPAAICLPVLFPFFRSIWHMLALTCLTTSCIELIQGISGMGLFEFDDILNNTAGAVLGWAVYRGIFRLVNKRRAKRK